MDERDDIAQLVKWLRNVRRVEFDPARGFEEGAGDVTLAKKAAKALLRLQRERDDANAIAQEMIEEANAIQRKLAEAYERAAKVCDEMPYDNGTWSSACRACARAIRSLTSGRDT